MFAINQKVCTMCGGCASVCPEIAIIVDSHKSAIGEKCLDCGVCAVFCPVSAIAPAKKAREDGKNSHEI